MWLLEPILAAVTENVDMGAIGVCDRVVPCVGTIRGMATLVQFPRRGRSLVSLFAQRLGHVFRFQGSIALLHLNRDFAAGLACKVCLTDCAANGIVQIPGNA